MRYKIQDDHPVPFPQPRRKDQKKRQPPTPQVALIAPPTFFTPWLVRPLPLLLLCHCSSHRVPYGLSGPCGGGGGWSR